MNLKELRDELLKLSSKYTVTVSFDDVFSESALYLSYKNKEIIEILIHDGITMKTEHWRDSLPFSRKVYMLLAEWSLDKNTAENIVDNNVDNELGYINWKILGYELGDKEVGRLQSVGALYHFSKYDLQYTLAGK